MRDKEGREVDFVIVKDGKVSELFECKWSGAEMSPSLQYYGDKLAPRRATQLVATAKTHFKRGQLTLQPVSFLATNPLL